MKEGRLSPYLLSVARVIIGLLFFQHGAEKLWGFAGGRIDHNFGTLRGFAGPLEIAGGSLIVLGLFTRFTAFILCGEMAVAYFKSWAPRGFFPIQNGGEEAVLFCFIYLWLVTAGPGKWSLDNLIDKSRPKPQWRHRLQHKRPGPSLGSETHTVGSGKMVAQASACEPPIESTASLAGLGDPVGTIRDTIASWDGYGLSVVRIILGFTFGLHGFRLAFGLLPALAGRRIGMPMALDLLPTFVGYWEIAGGILLMAGLFTKPTALISSIVALAAYFYAAAPRGVWPIRNGGNEVLLYALMFGYLAASGAGVWSLDQVRVRSARYKRRISQTVLTPGFPPS